MNHLLPLCSILGGFFAAAALATGAAFAACDTETYTLWQETYTLWQERLLQLSDVASLQRPSYDACQRMEATSIL
jgi:hypothetical protein